MAKAVGYLFLTFTKSDFLRKINFNFKPMAEEHIITLHITDREGKTHLIEAPTDMNLNIMEVCKASDLPVKGTCGGTASCASCHVYILSENYDLIEPSDEEEDMLDSAFFVEDNSRLGCQIYIHDGLDGLSLQLAPEDDTEA